VYKNKPPSLLELKQNIQVCTAYWLLTTETVHKVARECMPALLNMVDIFNTYFEAVSVISTVE
jgi:hypothetical protein